MAYANSASFNFCQVMPFLSKFYLLVFDINLNQKLKLKSFEFLKT